MNCFWVANDLQEITSLTLFFLCVFLYIQIFLNRSVSRMKLSYTLFFISNAFFNSASVLLNFFVNWATNVTWVLLDTYNHYYTEAYFMCSIFVPMFIGLGLLMSYLCDLFLISSLIFIFINHITSLKQTHLAFVQFLEYLLLFLDDNLDEESE